MNDLYIICIFIIPLCAMSKMASAMSIMLRYFIIIGRYLSLITCL